MYPRKQLVRVLKEYYQEHGTATQRHPSLACLIVLPYLGVGAFLGYALATVHLPFPFGLFLPMILTGILVGTGVCHSLYIIEKNGLVSDGLLLAVLNAPGLPSAYKVRVGFLLKEATGKQIVVVKLFRLWREYQLEQELWDRANAPGCRGLTQLSEMKVDK